MQVSRLLRLGGCITGGNPVHFSCASRDENQKPVRELVRAMRTLHASVYGYHSSKADFDIFTLYVRMRCVRMRPL